MAPSTPTQGDALPLTVAQARRVALAAQGFSGRRRAGPVGRPQLRRVLEQVAVVQVDSVNVLARSHYLPFYSRLGPYDRGLLDQMRDAPPHEVVEYWAHEASLMPAHLWPLLGFRMRRAEQESWAGMRRVAAERPDVVSAVLDEVRRHGPCTSRQVEAALARDTPRSQGEWGWNWSMVKQALEHLFWSGSVTSAGRTTQFERRYAIPCAVLPADVLRHGPHGQEPLDEDEAVTALVERSARALGVGTERCLRDYFRLTTPQVRLALGRLTSTGLLTPARVDGWRQPAYLHRDARMPGRVRAQALLSPFDSLIWQRGRVRALFGFDYRLEIYTPPDKRVHGYYVLPFLLGDRLVGRVDLKAERAAGVLAVRAAHWEPHAPAHAAAALAEELASMAGFLGLASVDWPARAQGHVAGSAASRAFDGR